MRAGTLVVVSLAFLAATTAPSVAADPEAPPQAVERRLASIAESLERIAGTLERILSEQRVEVVIRRMELEARRIAPLEQELRSAREELRGRRANVEQIRTMRDDLEGRIDEAIRSGADPATLPERDEMRNLEAMLAFEESRVEEAERRVLELEQDLDRGRDAIRILDDTLRELLDGS